MSGKSQCKNTEEILRNLGEIYFLRESKDDLIKELVKGSWEKFLIEFQKEFQEELSAESWRIPEEIPVEISTGNPRKINEGIL